MNIENLMKKTYGEKILLADANKMIKEFIDLNAITVKSVKQDGGQGINIEPSRRTRAVELNGNRCNAFIFSKDLIMRFFDGGEEDEFGNPRSANFLMVILGAHTEDVVRDGQEFKAGSFTVLTAGCERRVVKVNDEDRVGFYALNIPEAANEYPPHQVVLQLEPKEGLLPDGFFLVAE
ncbi:hypothetical protein [Chryseolinea soli]|uniref:Uncharacterized protein n=1 Tax=Chryseolinea soli TaxID=2321403 RepID=A0A385SRE2_9BACT|nr:hypothetical protein [Chryseolinea soli]AYB32180.1 hypothetical protein D4L85_17085 [Chryseolinea soli]